MYRDSLWRFTLTYEQDSKDPEYRSENMKPRYPGTGIDVIAAFGNRSNLPFIITINSIEQMLYFKKP